MQVRTVRLLRLDDPIESDDLDAIELKRIRQAEAARRYRQRHPDRVKARNAANYKKHRAERLAAKKSARNGPERRAFLARARKANEAYRERHPGIARKQASESYARRRVGIILKSRAERRAGNAEHYAKISEKKLRRNQRGAMKMNAARGGRVFEPVPIGA